MSMTAMVERIKHAREQNGNHPLESKDLIALFNNKELDTLLASDETASILSAMANRKISTDYVKLLRLRGRLPFAKKAGERAYLYRLRDALFVQLREKRSLSDIA